MISQRFENTAHDTVTAGMDLYTHLALIVLASIADSVRMDLSILKLKAVGDFLHILDYQWNDVLIPYWQKESEYAAKYGVNKIAFEMHPGFCVYNPETLMKLRNAVGPCLGANFDPSHLIWQGIDPVEAIRYIGENGAMFHFHAKDTCVNRRNTEINGVLDTKHYSDEIHRSWVFRALGYGTDEKKWKDMISMLQLVGYNHVMSIEHEDSFMTSKEGLEKAIAFLRRIIISEPKPGGMFWA